MKYPFEADWHEILADPDQFVSAVFSSLASEFLVLPKGEGFVECSALKEYQTKTPLQVDVLSPKAGDEG